MRVALVAAAMMVPVLAEAQTNAERGMLNQITPEIGMGAAVGAAVDQQQGGFRTVDRSEGDRALLGITPQASLGGQEARREEKRAAWNGETALLGGTRRES